MPYFKPIFSVFCHSCPWSPYLQTDISRINQRSPPIQGKHNPLFCGFGVLTYIASSVIDRATPTLINCVSFSTYVTILYQSTNTAILHACIYDECQSQSICRVVIGEGQINQFNNYYVALFLPVRNSAGNKSRACVS